MPKVDDYLKADRLAEGDVVYLVHNGSDRHATLEQIKGFVLEGRVLTSSEVKRLISEEIKINEPKW